MKNKKLNKFTLTNIKCYGMVLIAFAIMYPLQSAGIISNSIRGQLVPICTYIVMAISLNLTVGFLGELSLGHAGFMSIGAFSGVITAASLQNSISSGPVILLVSIIVGGIAAGIAGLLIGIPVIRLRGDYLAIVTLAFGEIIKNIINQFYAILCSEFFSICTKNYTNNIHIVSFTSSYKTSICTICKTSFNSINTI